MARELPYFQFEPASWQNGAIQMASPEAKLAFIEICCTYWQRVGELHRLFAVNRCCGGNEKLLTELVAIKVVEVVDDLVVVSFLSEQLSEIAKKSRKAKASAKARWAKDREESQSERNANAMQSHPNRNANKIREDKIREDKTRTSKKFVRPSVDELTAYIKEKNLNVEPQRFFDHYNSNGWKVGKNSMKDWRAAARNWHRTATPTQKETNSQTSIYYAKKD